MRRFTYYCVALALVAACSTAQAATFRFEDVPFAGTNVLNTPGRQTVGGEDFISFSIDSDEFSLESTVFGVDSSVNFVNALAPNLPVGGVNVVVLQTFDDDADPLTPFGAGSAANLIANRITTPGAGFFIYFNSGLDLPRLVFSHDLNDASADLQILARILNLTGQDGRNALSAISEANFELTTTAVPEPATFSMIALGSLGIWRGLRRRRPLQS